MAESSKKPASRKGHGPSGNPAKRNSEAPAKSKTPRRPRPVDRSWVPWVFVPVGLIGVIWLVVFYIIGDFMPLVNGGWNVIVGMGLMAASFVIATLWK